MLNLSPEHVASKKKVGKKGSNPVWEVVTTGGLYVDILGKGSGFEIIGTGPHRAIARHIAESKIPDIVWNELSKGEDFLPVEEYEFLLPKYIELTDRFRALQE